MAVNWGEAARLFPSENKASEAQAATPRDVRPDERALYSDYRMSLPLLFCWLLLLAFGFLMMFSASYGTSFIMSSTVPADGSAEASVVGVIPEADASHLARRQAAITAFSVVLALVFAYAFPFRQLTRKRLSTVVWLLMTPLLVAVRLFSAPINGARRWFSLGSWSFQPSELAKIALIFFLANYFSARKNERQREEARLARAGSAAGDGRRRGAAPSAQNAWKQAYLDVTKPALMMMTWILLVLIQPHLSGAIILTALMFVMFFLATIPRKSRILGSVQILVIALVLLLLLALVFPYIQDDYASLPEMVNERFAYAMKRVNTFQNPESATSDERMQVTQAAIALGSGGLSGQGFGTSVQKLNWLSEAHNDFILPIIGEELGFVGVIAVIALFFVFLWCGLSIARRAKGEMARLAAAGYTIFIALQAFLNIAVSVGIMPATGISLPFFSYGGTSNMFFSAAVGVLLCISKSATETDRELSRVLGKNSSRS